VIDPATQAEVIRLFFVEKAAQRAIAARFGLNRETVSAIISRRAVHLDRSEHGKRVSMLAPHYLLIDALLKEDPARSAVNILQRLRGAGYAGGITILKDYLVACRPASSPTAYLSLEFLPGQAAQVDWGEFGDVFGLGRKVHCFVMVLCYSRMLFLEFTLSANFESFIRSHEHAFAFFGSVPREIWYDNLATAVAERHGRLVRFNPRFFVYTGHHRFRTVACNPASGNEKGRVEDGVRYVRHNFWPGRSFADLDDLNEQARQWRNEFANRRTHGSTRKVPELVFEEEKKSLMPPQGPFDTDEIRSPRVSHQFQVDFDGNRYSVPWRMAGKIVTVRADEKDVRIFYGTKRIAGHPRSWRRGETISRESHKEGLIDQKPGAQQSADIQAVKSLGGNAARYLELIPAQTGSIKSELSRLMVLITVYGADPVEKVMGRALSQGIVGAIHLERMLVLDESDAAIKHPAPLSLSDPRLNLPRQTPDLKRYDAILLEPESVTGDKDHAETDRPDEDDKA
jgi:transposase